MARSFNGTSDHISNTSATLSSSATSVTVSCWVFDNEGTTSNINIIFLTRKPAGGFGSIWVQNGAPPHQLGWQTFGSKWFGQGAGTTTATLPHNSWFHLAATFDPAGAGIVTFYVNGSTFDTTQPLTSGFTDVPTNIWLGSNDTPANYFGGYLADFAQWTTLLSPSEISGLAKGVRPWRVRRASLATYYPLDGLQSPEPDLSGAANNGTLTGTAPVFGPPFAPFTPRMPQLFLPPAMPPLMAQIVT